MRFHTTVQPLDIVNLRVTFRKAPIHLLEKFTFSNQEQAYQNLVKGVGLRECIILQTCNRIELFASSKNINEKNLLQSWAEIVSIPFQDLETVVEVSRGKEVALHLMKLTSGLDSLVIGEDQILGQVKRAFEYSRKSRYCSCELSTLFERAIRVGSRVRASTGVNKGSVSIGSMAVNLAEEHFDSLENKKIMLIGTGEGASLIAKSLKLRGVKFMITSRTFERAKAFSSAVGGKPVLFDKALEMFHEIDLIFVSTTAPYYLVTSERIEKAMSERSKGLMIFDLSNPRTVEESVASIKKVKMINMDQIAEIVDKNTRMRKNEIKAAQQMIDSEMRNLDLMLKRKRAEPTVVSVFKNVEIIRQRELTKALEILDDRIGTEEKRVIEQLSHAIVEGILSTPMNNLRNEIALNDREDLVGIVAKLFNYEEKR